MGSLWELYVMIKRVGKKMTSEWTYFYIRVTSVFIGDSKECHNKCY